MIETRCAGVALLLRAVLDAHLPSLLSNDDFPSPALSPEQRLQTVLLRCFEVWSGTDSASDEPGESLDSSVIPAEPEHEYDAGFLLLAGIDPEAEAIHLPGTLSLSDLSSFQQTWEEHLAGLRLTSTGNLAEDLLRLWARWLRGFADSSVPFLLENFIRRPGYLSVSPTEIKVEMEQRTLDMVLEMADYLAPIETIAWLGGRRLSFTLSAD